MKQILKQVPRRMLLTALVRPVAAILEVIVLETVILGAVRRARVKALHPIVQKVVAPPRQIRTLVSRYQKEQSVSRIHRVIKHTCGFYLMNMRSYLLESSCVRKIYAQLLN